MPAAFTPAGSRVCRRPTYGTDLVLDAPRARARGSRGRQRIRVISNFMRRHSVIPSVTCRSSPGQTRRESMRAVRGGVRDGEAQPGDVAPTGHMRASQLLPEPTLDSVCRTTDGRVCATACTVEATPTCAVTGEAEGRGRCSASCLGLQLIVRTAPEGEVACRLLLEVVTPATRPRQLQLHPLPTADHLGADVTHLAGREFDLWMGRGLCQKLAPHKLRPKWRRSHLT